MGSVDAPISHLLRMLFPSGPRRSLEWRTMRVAKFRSLRFRRPGTQGSRKSVPSSSVAGVGVFPEGFWQTTNRKEDASMRGRQVVQSPEAFGGEAAKHLSEQAESQRRPANQIVGVSVVSGRALGFLP